MKNYALRLLGVLLIFQVSLGRHISWSSNSISFGPFSRVRQQCFIDGYEVIGWARSLQKNEVFLYMECTTHNFNKYLQELDQKFPHFNKVYNSLSKSERKLFKSYHANTLKLYQKAKSMKRLDWTIFEKKIITFLTPYKSLAEKFIKEECFVFNVMVGSESTTWTIGYDYKWPNGFGILSSKDSDIRISSDTPKTVGEYMSHLYKNELFVKVYQSCSDDEKKEYQKFVVNVLNLYYKVGSGVLNHSQFHGEARELLKPYNYLAYKFVRQGCMPFVLSVVMFNGSVMKVGYFTDCNGSLSILCKIHFPKK